MEWILSSLNFFGYRVLCSQARKNSAELSLLWLGGLPFSFWRLPARSLSGDLKLLWIASLAPKILGSPCCFHSKNAKFVQKLRTDARSCEDKANQRVTIFVAEKAVKFWVDLRSFQLFAVTTVYTWDQEFGRFSKVLWVLTDEKCASWCYKSQCLRTKKWYRKFRIFIQWPDNLILDVHTNFSEYQQH